uniref:U-myrmeciitoxin(01)-Mg6a n=1 Tax=Myrmecia gulosa TaxID=36170 RepID=TX16A_MYRGU|nr:RecName: Full=U-myrmeciitoxin(01)-Mg6a; Short=MIITX(01)-Mg6a; Short=U-MIITX(01)-Mg6a; Flags: Precursor [Myrmecia gulosa]
MNLKTFCFFLLGIFVTLTVTVIPIANADAEADTFRGPCLKIKGYKC